MDLKPSNSKWPGVGGDLDPIHLAQENGLLGGPARLGLPGRTFVARLRWDPHRQRAPAVAQVRARGGPLPGFRRNRAGSRVWKLPP